MAAIFILIKLNRLALLTPKWDDDYMDDPPRGPQNLPTPDEHNSDASAADTVMPQQIQSSASHPSLGVPVPADLPTQPVQPRATVTRSQKAAPAKARPQQTAPTAARPPSTAKKDDNPSNKAHAARKELQEAIQHSNEILTTATTAFPFTLFPDTVTVDRAKLTVTKRTFFGSAEVMSMRLEDVLNATTTIGPFFGSLQLQNRIANSQPYTVAPFWRKDAVRLKRVVQGYVIALQKKIDVSSLGTAELATMLEKLGEDDHSNVEN